MSDVASLLLEIETAHKANNTSNSPESKSFLGSLFDNDDDDIDINLIKSNNNEKNIKSTPDISLCTTGKSCIIHNDPSKNHSNSNNDLFPIKSIPNQAILTDKYDIRHSFSSFDMKEIISTQQRLATNKSIYAKQWQDDKEWHLRDEKLLLMQENAQCTIAELQHQRYVDLKNKNKTDSTVNEVTGYSIDYFVPHSLLRPRTKMEHALMEKVAMWAVEKGIQFESMIKIKQINNPKFAFLATAHKLHSYYTFLKQRIKTPHLFTQKSDKKVTETVKVKPTDAAKSIASHFLTYYSDDSECDNSESSSLHSNSNSHSDKCDNRMRERSYSNSRSKSRSRSRSMTPILATKRSGKNSKRRKAMEMERRKTRSFSRSLSRSRSRSRSLSRSRRRRDRRSRSRSFSSMSSYSSSVDSFYRDRKGKASRKRRDKRRNYRYSRSRSRSRSRGEYRKKSKRRYGRNYKKY